MTHNIISSIYDLGKRCRGFRLQMPSNIFFQYGSKFSSMHLLLNIGDTRWIESHILAWQTCTKMCVNNFTKLSSGTKFSLLAVLFRLEPISSGLRLLRIAYWSLHSMINATTITTTTSTSTTTTTTNNNNVYLIIKNYFSSNCRSESQLRGE